MFGLKTAVVTKACKRFQEVTRLQVVCSQPADFLARACSRLGLEADFAKLCSEVVERTEQAGFLREVSPQSLAAACIYLCLVLCELKLDRQALAAACQVSFATISKCDRKLKPHQEFLSGGEDTP